MNQKKDLHQKLQKYSTSVEGSFPMLSIRAMWKRGNQLVELILIKPRLPWEQPSLLLNFTFGIHLPLDNTSDLWLRSGELVGQLSIGKQTIGK